jgi:hypothetical protein
MSKNKKMPGAVVTSQTAHGQKEEDFYGRE